MWCDDYWYRSLARYHMPLIHLPILFLASHNPKVSPWHLRSAYPTERLMLAGSRTMAIRSCSLYLLVPYFISVRID